MPINSKNKGNGFERKIANLLATNFPPLQFTRSQSSGAILGGKNISKLIHYSKEAAVLFTGDVVPTNEGSNTGLLFNFCIECKFYKNEDSLYSMLSGKSKIHNWFKEVQIDARKIGKEPLLIFKFNRIILLIKNRLHFLDATYLINSFI
jgi:hypothetical protein